ncbi:MAG: GTP cyclohydrolase I FolE [Dehalococcoidia bacterium]
MDIERIEKAVRDILEAIGDDPNREGLLETPGRVARMYEEIMAGMEQDAIDILSTQFDEDHQEMVIVRDIPFYSVCEHHLAPFFGMAHVAYIPRGKVVGISKIARAVDVFARRPQVQERLTSQLADAMMAALDPEGVAIVIKAEHLCLSMRGVRKPGTAVVTSATRGEFRGSEATRMEFLSLLQDGIH